MAEKAWTGDEWDTWGSQSDGERWKPSGAVGSMVRLRLKGYQESETSYGLWQRVEADVDVVEGEEFTTHHDVALSGAWFIRRFRDAPVGYHALGVITVEQFAKGQGYAMRPLDDAERAHAERVLGIIPF